MPDQSRREDEHMLSFELKSRKHIKRITMMPNEKGGGSVLIEGFLGRLKGIRFVEGVMLEVEGANGTLRMDLKREELSRFLTNGGMKQ
jgi:hypothetical protein